jgi:hypothetical protein
VPPPDLTAELRRLPPILHSGRVCPTTSWSKAPRGLFVLPRVAGIFTGPAISPSPPPRQCPDRSTFRAGRNLPDKEFRYLRTVIVTAAVYRGFGSDLAALPLTFRHWAGLSPYASALVALAGTGVFGKQTPGPGHCGRLTLAPRWGVTLHAAPLLPKLRGQFAEFLSGGSLVHLSLLDQPTCVGLRYGRSRPG